MKAIEMHAKKMRITFYYCIRFKSIKIFVSVQHPAGMGIMQDKMLAFWTNETHSCGADKAHSASVSPGLQVQSTCNMGVLNSYNF